jgi:DNA-binding beta-propeller fold protein YncE
LNGARITAIDLATGVRTPVSSDSLPDAANALVSPSSIVLDEPAGRLLVTDAGLTAVVAVDIGSGARTIFSDNVTPDSNLPFSEPTGIVIDASRNLAVIGNSDMSFDSSLLGAELTAGTRTLLSDSTLPDSQTPLFDPRGMAINSDSDSVFVVNVRREQLLAVNLATGARTSVSFNFSPGFGVPFAMPGRIAFDPARQIVYLVNEGTDAILAIDVTTGQRVYLLR